MSALVAAVLLHGAAGLAAATEEPLAREQPFVVRPLSPTLGARWIGQGIAYGPHRDGQTPGGVRPTREQLRQDLHLLAPRWGLVRLYSADAIAEDVLSLVREEHLPMKVLLGAGVAAEPGPSEHPVTPDTRTVNRREVDGAVRLARTYPDLVLGIVVGNETQVSWSANRVPAEVLIECLRRARRGTTLPVATADDFGFWLEPGAEQVAAEVDFIVTHVHAMWNGMPIERALAFTQEKYRAVARRFPDRTVVLGEAGWATRKHTEGDQGTLIKGTPGEEPQRVFYEAFSAWVVKERVVSAWFEAFDENWKGSAHPDEVEKHWGLFRADRTPKRAMQPPGPPHGP